MEIYDRLEDRKFRVNLVGDGASRLRERVKEKLKEFMGDYTDDTLVEYVIVLLRNGRNKVEALHELNVFLGDDSDSFVSWLWDHLSSNLDVYMQACLPNDKGKVRLELTGKIDTVHTDMESEGGKPSRSRHNREWKSLVRDVTEPPPLKSFIVSNVHFEERSRIRRENESSPPEPSIGKKRGHADNHHPSKRLAISRGTNGASRRLLQFAVRDAVATARPSNGSPEPAVKRLRSVVSGPGGNDFIDARTLGPAARNKRLRSVALAKALTEADEDVKRPKYSASVFDRLGQAANNESGTLGDHEDDRYKDAGINGEYENFQKTSYCTHSGYALENFDFTRDLSLMESDTGVASESTCDDEGYTDYDNANVKKDANSTMVNYSIAENAVESHEIVRREPTKDLDLEQPSPSSNASRKIVNISVNVNTWKPPHYQSSKVVEEVDTRTTQQATLTSTSKSEGLLSKVKYHTATTASGNMNSRNGHQNKPEAMTQTGTVKVAAAQKPSNQPIENADARTIFVSNVHFAATKEGMSRHFNKFGEVLKVVIASDATTGLPKGAAYVEFARKEAGERALSLDGTSFMSRILKVVRKSAASRETVITHPRVLRGPSRFVCSFYRGGPGPFRARNVAKTGARSLQWKRDGLPTQTNIQTVRGGRGLTYVRPKPKPEIQSGTPA